MTKDDDLLRRLGALADEQREAPLPPELQTPLGDAFEQRALAALLPASSAPSEVVPLRRRNPWARRLAVGVPVALAASLLLFVVRTATSSPDTTLPRFVFEASGAVADLRSEQDVTPDSERTDAQRELELVSDTVLELVLRPERPSEAETAASLFVVRDSRTQRLALQPERSPDGAFRFAVPADLLLPTAGSATLVAWVGTGDDAKQSADEVPSSGQRFTRLLRRK